MPRVYRLAAMKVLCAPDSFKDSLTAREAAAAMAAGVRQAAPDAAVDVCPISDGGEGFADAFSASVPSRRMTAEVTGPLGPPIEARWVLLDGPPRTAVIEMASAAGLERMPELRRDPTKTTTFGVGELIAAALDADVRRVILGIGGSATNDGGAGAAQALGVGFAGAGRPLVGGDLQRIERVDRSGLDPRLEGVELLIACDVNNPLTGPSGAASVYGPQKGATPVQVAELDAGLGRLADLVGHDRGMPGAGAAGGLGYGAVALLGGRLRPGLELVLEAVGFAERVTGCDLCLTGEGKLDGQSLSGKAVLGVARRAAERGVKTYAMVGSVGDDPQAALDAGLAGYRVIGEGLAVDESIRRAAELLERATADFIRASA